MSYVLLFNANINQQLRNDQSSPLTSEVIDTRRLYGETVLVVSAGTDECTMTSMYMQVWEITSILHCGSIPEMMIVIEQAIIWW